MRLLTSLMLVLSLLSVGCAEDSTNVAAGDLAQGSQNAQGQIDAGIPFPGNDAGTTETVAKDAGETVEEADAGTTDNPKTDVEEECVPQCEGKECGPDGCGGVCGACDINCDDNGQCICTPDCTGKQCGDDGCGGVCGQCGAGGTCTAAGQCDCEDSCNSLDAECGVVCGQSCGTCKIGETCEAYQCTCEPSCVGKVCGDDGCGGSCGICPDNGECTAEGQCANCVADCEGKECGPDGCGGTCGPDVEEVCGLDGICNEETGQCISKTCCFTNDSPGCAVPELEECVCVTNNNPECCADDGSWGSSCVLAATLLCGATCSEAIDVPSCDDNCGKVLEGENGTCSCAPDCVFNENCCEDAAEFCELDELVVSCEGKCDQEITVGDTTCSCKEDCLFTGNCCEDVTDFCEIDEGLSCVGFCDQPEGEAPGTPGGCYCDSLCIGFGDCCEDACDVCGVCEEEIIDPPSDSCVDLCDGEAESGCSCKADCFLTGTEECCPDITEACGYENKYCSAAAATQIECSEEQIAAGECDDEGFKLTLCGTTASADSGCYCDDACLFWGDCCEDACDACGVCDTPDSCFGQCSDEQVEGAACQCDPGCVDRGDCCTDACELCGSCEFDPCAPENAVCEPGAEETQSCGSCGTSTRTCGDECVYGVWSECSGQGECAAGSSIPCDSGCGIIACSDTCEYSAVCEYDLDYYETNPADDDLDEPETIVWQGWFHNETDVDVYQAFVTENGGFDWTMKIDVSILGGVPGEYTLCVEYVKATTLEKLVDTCVTGINDVTINTGDLDSFGVTDNGFLKVEAIGPEGCSPYVIKVEVD